MIECLCADEYTAVTKYRAMNGRLGGQELILPEILSAMADVKKVWVPFYSSGCLSYWLRRHGKEVFDNPGRDTYNECPDNGDALYFGTPTIVNGVELFPISQSHWTKESERDIVRAMVAAAEKSRYQLIVSGLGSGDISVEERLSDMGGGKVICYKDFGDFQDWVLCRRLG